MNRNANSFAAKALVSALFAAPALVFSAQADDIRLINQAPGWNTLPLAIAQDGMPFKVRNQTDANEAQFASWATMTSVTQIGEFQIPRVPQVLRGDFNGDGRTDLALLSRGFAPQWNTMPVAYANADGSVRVENRSIGQFADAATYPTSQLVMGDFNNDKRTDLALVRLSAGSPAAPVLLSQSDGSFIASQWNLGVFAAKAAALDLGGVWRFGSRIVTGDFNGDGYSDLAVIHDCGQDTTIPVAYAQPGGGFLSADHPTVGFEKRCSSGAYQTTALQPGSVDGETRIVLGDFNGDGKTDIARFVNGTLIVATSTGSGFSVSAPIQNDFTRSAAIVNVALLTGRFDAGPTADIALVNLAGNWDHISMAYGDKGAGGTFFVRDIQAPAFASWATQGATPYAGDFDGNGQLDIALIPNLGTQSEGWATIPIAYSYMKDTPGPVKPCLPGLPCPAAPTTVSLPEVRIQTQYAQGFVDWVKGAVVRVIGDFGQ